MELMKSQRNMLLDIIKSNGLDPSNFEWDKEDDRREVISILKYKDTEYFFSVKISQGVFNCFYSPGYDIMYEKEIISLWNDVVVCFSRWLSNLSREISQPDLWEELEKVKVFDNLEFETENTMQQFSYQEIKQIQSGVKEIRNYLLHIRNDDSKIINEKLDYLIESSERMGRKDWVNIFYGALVSLSINLALDPQQGQTIVTLFKNAVSGIVKFIGTTGA